MSSSLLMPILKILIGGILIWLATEFGKRSGKLGGLVLSLPMTSLIALLWLWFETRDVAKVAETAKETLIFVLPSFVFFITLPLMLGKQIQFYVSFSVSIVLTLIAYFIFFKIRGEM